MTIKLPEQQVDWTKPHINGTDLQPQVVQQKFDLWDEVKHKLEEGDPEVIRLLKDNTIYEYAFFTDDDNNPFKLTAYQDLISGCITRHDYTQSNPNRYILYRAANQMGKLIADSELIPTPKGWVKNGSLKPGQQVYGSDGKITTIEKTTHHKNWNLYKITFNDGSFIYAGPEHLWKCKTSKERFRKTYTKNNKTWKNPSYNKWQVLSTQQIIEAGKYNPTAKSNYTKISIPVTKPVNYPCKQQELNPYLIGLLLGDGSLTKSTPSFTTGDEEIAKWICKHYNFKFQKKQNKIQGTIKNVYKQIKKLGLKGTDSSTKFIPQQYLQGNIQQRKELLKGLMDTDGSVYGKHSTLEYCTISEKLKDDFVELINSLGCLINKVTVKKPFYYDKNKNKVFGKTTHIIRFKTLFNPFNLSRKRNKWKKVTSHKHERIIEKIEYSHTENATCIEVDNKDKTYLASKQYIVTHNSRMLISAAKYLAFNRENKNIVIISKSLPQSQFVLSELRKSLNNSSFGNTWTEDIGETANTTMLTIKGKTAEGKEYINRIICAPAGEGSLGYPIHHLFLDEADFYEGAKTLFWKVLFARTKKTKGQIVLFSNPNPDISRINSLLAELWDGTLFQRKFHFQFLDAPWNTVEEFEIDQANSPAHIFKSTHLGEWSDIGGAFFSDKEIKEMFDTEWNNRLPPAQEEIYIAADLGKMNDHTWIAVGTTKEPQDTKHKYKDLDVRYLERLPLKTPYDKIADKLEYLIKYYEEKGARVTMGYDATGQKTFGDFLKRRNVNGIPVDFSAKKSNKTLLYNDFKLMAEQQKIKIVKERIAEKEFAGLEYKYTSSKNLRKVEHKTQSIHDDAPDTVAILIHIAVKPSHVPVGAMIVTRTRNNKENKDELTKAQEQIQKLNDKFHTRYSQRNNLGSFW